jgi:hypothetical protein
VRGEKLQNAGPDNAGSSKQSPDAGQIEAGGEEYGTRGQRHDGLAQCSLFRPSSGQLLSVMALRAVTLLI